jgi:hypothetical protein
MPPDQVGPCVFFRFAQTRGIAALSNSRPVAKMVAVKFEFCYKMDGTN